MIKLVIREMHKVYWADFTWPFFLGEFHRFSWYWISELANTFLFSVLGLNILLLEKEIPRHSRGKKNQPEVCWCHFLFENTLVCLWNLDFVWKLVLIGSVKTVALDPSGDSVLLIFEDGVWSGCLYLPIFNQSPPGQVATSTYMLFPLVLGEQVYFSIISLKHRT